MTLTIALGALALVALAPAAAATDAATGAATAQNDSTGGTIQWEVNSSDQYLGAPTVANGTVYVTGGSGIWDNVLAYDAETGELQWRHSATSSVRDPPSVANGTVYVIDAFGTVFAIDADTGHREWSLDVGIGGGVMISSVVQDGTAYLVSRWEQVIAVDLESREVEWRVTGDGYDVTSYGLSVADDAVYFGSDTGVHAVNASSGAELWNVSTDGRVVAAPTATADGVFVGSYGGTFYGIDRQSGSVRWTDSDVSRYQGSSPTVANGTVYAGSSYNRGDVLAYDAETGTGRWRSRAPADITSFPVTVAGDAVLVPAGDGTLHAFDAQSGDHRWATSVGSPQLPSGATVWNGTAYYGGDEGTVTAVELRGTATSEGSRVRHGSLGHVGDRSTGDTGDPSTASVRFEVVDELPLQLVGATVEVVDDGAVVANGTTDEHGRVELEVPEGTSDVTVRYHGRTETQRVPIEDGDDVRLQTNFCDDVPFLYTPAEPTAGDVVTFEACPDVDAPPFSRWDFEANNSAIPESSEQWARHTYDLPGTYTVEYAGETRAVEVEPGTDVEIDEISGSAYHQLDGYGGDEIPIGVTVANYSEVESVEIEHGDTSKEAAFRREVERPEPTFGADPREESSGDQPNLTQYGVVFDTDEIDTSPGIHVVTIRVDSSSGFVQKTVPMHVLEPGPELEATLDDVDVESEFDGLHYERELYDLRYSVDPDHPVIGETPLQVNPTNDVDVDVDEHGTFDYRSGEFVTEYETEGWGDVADRDFWDVVYEEDHRSWTEDDTLRVEFDSVTISVNYPEMPVGSVGNPLVSVGLVAEPRQQFELESFEPSDGPLDRTPTNGSAGTWNELRASSSVAGLEVDAYEGGIYVHTNHGYDPDATPVPTVHFPIKGWEVDPYGSIEVDYGIGTEKVNFDELYDVQFSEEPTREEPDWPTQEPLRSSEAADASSIELDDVQLSEEPTREEPDRLTQEPLGSTEAADASSIELDDPLHPAGDAPPDGAATATGTASTGERVTERNYRDAAPSLEPFEDGHLAAWSTHRPETPAEHGQDVAVAVRENQSWGDRTYLTGEDVRSDIEPVVATDGSEALVAWIGANDAASAETLSESFAQRNLYYARYDGDEWSDPRAVTATDDAVVQPGVAAVDDEWVLTWEQSETVVENRTVRYATVGDDSDETTRDLGPGALPDVASVAEHAAIAYYDTEAGEVVRERIGTDGTAQELARHETDEPSSLAAAPGAAAWTNRSGSRWAVEYAENGTVERVELDGRIRTVSDLSLVDSDWGPLLNYRARESGTDATALVSRSLDDRAVDRTIARSETNATLSSVAVAPGDDRLVALLGARTSDSVTDLFEVTRPFRPDYVVEATTEADDVVPGDTAEVAYTVANAGEQPFDENVTVAVRSGGEMQASESVPTPIDDGRHAGTATVEVSESGTVEVAVDASGEQHASDRARDTVHFSTPSLGVEDVVTTRTGNGTALANVAIGNDGPAAAENVTVQLRDGQTTVGNATVDRVAPEAVNSTSVQFDPDGVDPTNDHRVVLDPFETLPDDAFESDRPSPRSEQTRLLAPDATVSDHVRYYELPNGTVEAVVDVSNEGAGPLEGSVRVLDAETSAEIGSAPVHVNATDASTTRTERVRVSLDETDDGHPVWIDVKSTVSDADPSGTTVRDDVGPIVEARSYLEVTVTDAAGGAPIDGANVTVDDAEGRTDGNGTALLSSGVGDRTVTVSAEGYETETVLADVSPGDPGRLTVDLSPVSDEGSGNGGGIGPAPNPGDDSESDGAADVVVESLEVQATSPGVRETVPIEATVANVGSAAGTVELQLSVDGEPVGEPAQVALDAGESTEVRFEPTVESAGEVTLELGEASVTLDVQAVDPGSGDDGTDPGEAPDEGEEAEDDASDDSDDPSTGDEPDDGLPGFGPLVGLAALLLVAERRRSRAER